MKFMLIFLFLFALTACSFRGWDPPNYNQTSCQLYGLNNESMSSNTLSRMRGSD